MVVEQIVHLQVKGTRYTLLEDIVRTIAASSVLIRYLNVSILSDGIICDLAYQARCSLSFVSSGEVYLLVFASLFVI